MCQCGRDEPTKMTIIDTDIGIDDALALSFLAACKEINIIAVTLIQGNSEIDVITDNCERILTFLKRKTMPIFLSGSVGLSGDVLKSDGYYGTNGLADICLEKRKMGHRTDMSSAEALVYYARKYPKRINLLCIGPLMNVALAYLIDNSFPSLLASITIRGSDSSPKTFKGTTEFSEFNAWCDAYAYQVVMKNFKGVQNPLTVLDWNFCCNNLFNPSCFKEIISVSEKSGMNIYTQLLKILIDPENVVIKKSYWENGFLAPDLLTAICFYDRTIFASKRVKLQHIEISGTKIGHTVFQETHSGYIELVSSVDMDTVHEIFFRMMAFSLNPTKGKR